MPPGEEAQPPEELVPARALVRPRVVGGGPSPRLLEDVVADHLRDGRARHLQLVGGAGSGKTTALCHLAAVFAGVPQLLLADEGQPTHDGLRTASVVVAACRRPRSGVGQILELAPWSDDDVVEYLLARQPDAAGRAFTAWQQAVPAHDLAARPGVCGLVLDALAAGRGANALAALQALIEEHLPPVERAAEWMREHDRGPAASAAARRLLVSQTVRHMVHALDLLPRLGRGCETGPPALTRTYRAMPVLAWLLRQRPADEQRLLDALRKQPCPDLAILLMVFCATRFGFRPFVPPRGWLGFARLQGIDLSGMELQASFVMADLSRADLRHATLTGCCATQAFLGGARLDGAICHRLDARGLRAPRLSAPGVDLTGAMLVDADLSGAALDGATLRRAELSLARLNGASLRGADLRGAGLHAARLAGADLRDARLDGARLGRVDLRAVQLTGACLTGADLTAAQLAETRLPGLVAEGACLRGADLTAAAWPAARLRGVDFTEAGLAHVDFEGADLREVDFTRVAFHLGSSRSGLVGSAIASEGSRTGFYTDESQEADFQAPEDVRKANLRRCDLRGAKLDTTDFYLVDVRGARLDPSQREWLAKCRAIL